MERERKETGAGLPLPVGQTKEEELRERRIEMAKAALGITTITGGAVAMGFGNTPVREIGGVIFIGTFAYPLVEEGRKIVKAWRGDDLSDE